MENKKPPLRVVFMGTPEFAVPCLEGLFKNPELVNVVGVYTQPDKPAGRGLELKAPPVKILAQQYGVPVFQPVNINKDGEPKKLADLMADVVVVVAYAQFLNHAILNTPRLGCLNVHASLLPKYRGAAPIQYALLNGDGETGVSIMRLILKMDAGPVFLQKKLTVLPEDTSQTVSKRLSVLGEEALMEVLQGLQKNLLNEKEQDETLVSYAPLIKKNQGLINWNQPASVIHNQVRGFFPWPCAFTNTVRGTLKVLETQISAMGPSEKSLINSVAGSVVCEDGLFLVKTADSWLDLRTVQPEGKRPMTGQEFINGLQSMKENLILQ